MKNFKAVFYFSTLFLIYSCSGKKDNSNAYEEKGVHTSESYEDNILDTCSIDEVEINEIINCKVFSLKSGKYIIDNDDFGIDITLLKGNNYFVYSNSTGRAKILQINGNEIKESIWFDDDAGGDSVLLRTINQKGFYVFDPIEKEKYFVPWNNGFDVVRKNG